MCNSIVTTFPVDSIALLWHSDYPMGSTVLWHHIWRSASRSSNLWFGSWYQAITWTIVYLFSFRLFETYWSELCTPWHISTCLQELAHEFRNNTWNISTLHRFSPIPLKLLKQYELFGRRVNRTWGLSWIRGYKISVMRIQTRSAAVKVRLHP